MDARHLHRVIPLAVSVLIAACQGVEPSTLPVRPEAVIDLGSALAAARLSNGSVEVLVQDSSGTRSGASARPARADKNTVHLASSGGDTGTEFNTYVYGTAVPGVSLVRLSGFDGLGGQIVDGTWVIVLREKDVTPTDLQWEFHAPDGSVRASGEGIQGHMP